MGSLDLMFKLNRRLCLYLQLNIIIIKLNSRKNQKMSRSHVRRSSLGCDINVHSSEFQMNLAKKQGVETSDKGRRNSSKQRNNKNRIIGAKNVAAFFPFLCLTLRLNSCYHSGVHSAPVENHV